MCTVLLSDRIWVLTFIRLVLQLIILIVKQWPLVPGHRSVVNIHLRDWLCYLKDKCHSVLCDPHPCAIH